MAAKTSTFLPLLLLLSLLLLRPAVSLPDFEGFDADDDETDLPPPSPVFTPSPSTLTRSSTPESSPISDPAPKPASSLPDWDEDEFEGFPDPLPDSTPDPVRETPTPEAIPRPEETPKSFPKSYPMEIACVSFLIAFAFNYFTGKKENEAVALAWASMFATKDKIFEKNFSLLGVEDGNDTPLLLKEGQDVFKFYASGRRFCQGLLATMELKSRHDLISRIFDLVMPKKETITFEVVMNDDAMDNVIFALARKKLAKSIQKEEADLQRYAGLVLSPPAGRRWVPEELVVVTESKEVAGDMLTDTVLDQVFGDKAFEKFGKWFISMHFSDQCHGSQKKMLIFKFALPDRDSMAKITRLMVLVPYYIDLVGRYKLSSQARPKTETARAKVAQELNKELQNARQEELQKKKAEKKKMLEEAASKLSAEALRKKEEKDRARQMKKSMPKVKMLR